MNCKRPRWAPLAAAAGLFFSACSRDTNPLLALPAGGVTSASITIPQIETHDEPFNKVFMSVLDNSLAPLQSFQLGNFSLLENGRPVVPEEVGPVTGPLYIALVIDRSGSMSAIDPGSTVTRSSAATTAALALVSAMGPSDQMCYIEFDSSVYLRVPFTSDQTALNTSILAGTPGSATALYDGISTAADQLKQVSGRKLLIVLGDGDDNSSQISKEGSIEDVLDAGVAANMVVLGTGVADTSIFSGIASATGGSFNISLDGTNLSTIFTDILAAMLNLVYVKYRKHAQSGTLTVYLNYGPITASASRRF